MAVSSITCIFALEMPKPPSSRALLACSLPVLTGTEWVAVAFWRKGDTLFSGVVLRDTARGCSAGPGTQDIVHRFVEKQHIYGVFTGVGREFRPSVASLLVGLLAPRQFRKKVSFDCTRYELEMDPETVPGLCEGFGVTHPLA